MLVCVGGLTTIILILWYVTGIGFLVAALDRRDRWALAALLALPLGFIQTRLIDQKAISEHRWQAIRPKFEAQLSESLKISLKPEGQYAFGVRKLRSDIRVVVDRHGNRSVAFVRYRVGLDNGLAYVYSPADSLQVELGRSHTTGLGRALSGFGEIAHLEPLGNHWYRCYFT